MTMNDRSLQLIRAELSKRRDLLTERCGRIDRDLARRDGALSADFGEQAVETENDQSLEAIGACAAEEIRAVDEALRRLDAGRFGICKDCGDAIAPARLKTIPYAVTCVQCGLTHEYAQGLP